MRNLILFFVILLSVACSGSGSSSGKIPNNLAITVTGSRSFNSEIVHGKIDHYLVTITADDLAAPFTAQFGGSSGQATMLGIPAGSNRTLRVEAVNPNGLVIRRGVSEGLVIQGNKISQVEVAMHAVPIFTNLQPQGALLEGRSTLGIFAEPSSQIQVVAIQDENETVLVDQTSGRAFVDTDTNTDGLYTFTPKNWVKGVMKLELRDTETGESSQVALTVIDRGLRPGISVSAGGNSAIQGEELVLTQVGQSLVPQAPNRSTQVLNSLFLDIVEMLF